MKNALAGLGLIACAGIAIAQSPTQFPDEARKQLVEVLGGQFIVFRDKVLDELKLSDEQKQKLLEKFPDFVQDTMKLFDKVQGLKPEEREKEMQQHRRKCDESLSACLKNLLDAKQRERLFQLQLQQAGVFALLGEHESFLKLKITDEQRKKFIAVVQEMEKSIQTLVKDAGAGARPEELTPKAAKLRKEHATIFESLLSDAQKKQWQELLGKPFDLGE